METAFLRNMQRFPRERPLRHTKALPIRRSHAWRPRYAPPVRHCCALMSASSRLANQCWWTVHPVGSAVMRSPRTLGARVCGTCRPANADYVRSVGAELVLSYEQKDLLAQLRGWMPGGIDVILDCHSGGQKTEMLDVLVPGGRLIALATLNNDGDVPAMAALARAKQKEFHFLLMDYETLVQDIASINSILARGMFAMPDITVFPLERAAEALQAVKRGGIRGKIVVEIAKLP